MSSMPASVPVKSKMRKSAQGSIYYSMEAPPPMLSQIAPQQQMNICSQIAASSESSGSDEEESAVIPSANIGKLYCQSEQFHLGIILFHMKKAGPGT